MPPGARGCRGRSPRRRAESRGRPDDRTRSSAGATMVASGRWMGWYATSSAKPSDSQTGTLRVVAALTVTWVSSWVMTTSRPSGRSELHAPGTRTIRSAPACSPGVSGPSVAAATPARSSAERPSSRAASASVAGATQTAGLASPHTAATRDSAVRARRTTSSTRSAVPTASTSDVAALRTTSPGRSHGCGRPDGAEAVMTRSAGRAGSALKVRSRSKDRGVVSKPRSL